MLRTWLVVVVLLTAEATIGLYPSASADEPKPRELMIDPLSRNFMSPFLEDFIRPDEIGVPFEEVAITNANGETLRGWFLPATNARHTILFCMGNTGNISSMLMYARVLLDGGFNVLLFDYQGFGGSTGIATVMSLHGDAVSAFDYLTTIRKIPPADIGIFGVSLGSPLAVAVAAQQGAGAVAVEDILLPTKQLESIRGRLPDDFTTRMALGAIQAVVLPKLEPFANVPRLKCPMFLMHGEHDRLLSPTGTIEIAAISEVPTRVWIIQGAGHAPETLETNDVEYASQVQRFFREALSGDLAVPTVRLSSRKTGDEWLCSVTVESDQKAAWQISVGSTEGKFQFTRRLAQGDFTIDVRTPFEPTSASAVAFENVSETSHSDWTPKLSDLSRCLAEFRQLERDIGENCPIQERVTLSNRSLRRVSFRTTEHWTWLRTQLKDPKSVHPQVRPRHARMLGEFFATIPGADQEKCLDAIEAALRYLPEQPKKYFQLENAGFQLTLQDSLLAQGVILLAKKRFDGGQLDESKQLLRTAVSIGWRDSWLRDEAVERLTQDADFFTAIGSPTHGLTGGFVPPFRRP